MININIAFVVLALAFMATSIATTPIPALASHHDTVRLAVEVDDRDELIDILGDSDDRDDFVDDIADRAEHKGADSIDLVIIYDDSDSRAGHRITEVVESLVNDELDDRDNGHENHRDHHRHGDRHDHNHSEKFYFDDVFYHRRH